MTTAIHIVVLSLPHRDGVYEQFTVLLFFCSSTMAMSKLHRSLNSTRKFFGYRPKHYEPCYSGTGCCLEFVARFIECLLTSLLGKRGAFSHSAGTARAQRGHGARTAPITTLIIQVTTLKTTHLQNHAQSIQNSKIQTSDACHGSQGPKFCPL